MTQFLLPRAGEGARWADEGFLTLSILDGLPEPISTSETP